jgi:hypothetical protein
VKRESKKRQDWQVAASLFITLRLSKSMDLDKAKSITHAFDTILTVLHNVCVLQLYRYNVATCCFA